MPKFGNGNDSVQKIWIWFEKPHLPFAYNNFIKIFLKTYHEDDTLTKVRKNSLFYFIGFRVPGCWTMSYRILLIRGLNYYLKVTNVVRNESMGDGM